MTTAPESAETNPPVGVVVLGMHRSGTSMVTRMLHHAGFHIGREHRIMPPNPANPLGHYENLDIVDANDEALAELGGSWFSPPTCRGAAADRVAPRLRAALAALLGEAGDRPVAVKDPRIGLLLPLWWPLLRDVLYPVLTVRHPLEVARSLEERDEMPLPMGLAAWEAHMCLVLDTLEGRTVMVAPHRRLLADPRGGVHLVEQVRSRLRPDLAAGVRPEAAADATDTSLHRSTADANDLAAHLTTRQQELWRLLEALPSGEARLSTPADLRRLDEAPLGALGHEARRQEQAVALEWARAGLTYAEQEQARSNQHARQVETLVERRSAELADVVAQHEAAAKQLTKITTKLKATEARLRATEAQLEATTRVLEDHRASLTWRLSSPLRAVRRRLSARRS